MKLACAIALGMLAWVGRVVAEGVPGGPLQEAGHPVIEFPTVAAALEALTHRAGAEVHSAQGWTIVEENGGLTLWSFVPKDHPAYRAVVKRVMSQNGAGSWAVNMSVHCEAAKAACDQLVRDFDELNEQMRKDIEKRTGQNGL